MNKTENKKATLQDFLAKKIKREEDKDQIKDKDIYISSMDKTIICTKPNDNLVYDFMDDLGDKDTRTSRTTAIAYKKIIYKCCKELQSPQLHEELEIKDPYDVMNLFDFSDMSEIIPQFDELMGHKKPNVEIKNS